MLLERRHAAKDRAKSHNLEFIITIEDLKKNVDRTKWKMCFIWYWYDLYL